MVWMDYDPKDDDPKSGHGVIWSMAIKTILAVVVCVAIIVALGWLRP
jgi:hypothetical protein